MVWAKVASVGRSNVAGLEGQRRIGSYGSGEGVRKSSLVMVAGLKWDVRKIIDRTRYYSYVKLLRVTALCMRFINARLERRQAVRDIELPAERVTPTGPFRYVGLDFAGLILTRSRGTHHEFSKTYVCVFTCMVVMAIYLELVMDMTVNSFRGAFLRVCAIPVTLSHSKDR
ncbi:hypothetical protein T07_11547 [Trichinella nelsoni]|uniref:Uncharacterized protein n=1 Tax=Trichinella nelsoni TaxID=6336 RepID=A0A0V0SAR2_9BILA|nr:hypothetical protein T07_11547 [Trichinella nelsoni]